MLRTSFWLAILGTSLAIAPLSEAATFELKKGDSIALLGGGLPERMQHSGWFETLLQARFPQHELVVRNLSLSGDEVNTWHRSEGYGSRDEWLTRTKASVIFAFYGFNESFAGEAGLEAFKKNLDDFLRHMAGQKYAGAGAPRVVLVTPLAHENLKNRNLPDGSENNARLAAYSKAMQEMGALHDVVVLDLFTASSAYFGQGKPPLTINGIHLSEAGDKVVAEMLLGLALGPNGPAPEAGQLEKLRAAVNEKGFYWFHRYRVTDGFSVYGGRSHLKFVEGQTNRDVMMRELEIHDALTANRDRRIWAVAQGSDLKVDDSNVPEYLPVKTNKPGAGADGQHIFLGGEAAIEKMSIHKDMEVKLFASEEQFPELVNPVQMAFDTKGRLWVAVWPQYPHYKPRTEMNDKLLILEDTNGDGRADVCKTFADRLNNPTGFEFWGGGVIVGEAPYLTFLQDTNGDDKVDTRERVLHGIDSADTHHTANSFVLDPGGALYFQEGVFHRTQVETHWGVQRNNDAAVWRFEPRTLRFERYAPFGFANPHGHVFDRWGQDIVTDGTGAQPYHGTLISGWYDGNRKHPHPPQVYKQRTRPCPATEILSSQHFPPEMQNTYLVENVIGFQGILHYKLEDDSSSIKGTEIDPIVSSSDPNFRPTDLEVGPDGAIWFVDWQNPIIGHMQHNLRDPSRDRLHGRIYRVTYKGRPLNKPVAVAGEPIEKLLDLLKSEEDRLRSRVRIELSGRDSDQVIAAAKKWVAGLDKQDANYEHHVLEALWLHQSHNVVDEALLKRVLRSPEPKARAAATRVLCVWRRDLPATLDLLRPQVTDEHPRVRLEALRALSYLSDPEALEVALEVLTLPTDPYLDYLLKETTNQLESLGKPAPANNAKSKGKKK